MPDEPAAKSKPWINARVEKALTGRYFRHMFREGRVIIPVAGMNGRARMVGSSLGTLPGVRMNRSLWLDSPNYKPRKLGAAQQTVDVGFVVVTEDCEGGMVHIHDRRPIVLAPEMPGAGWNWQHPSRKRHK